MYHIKILNQVLNKLKNYHKKKLLKHLQVHPNLKQQNLLIKKQKLFLRKKQPQLQIKLVRNKSQVHQKHQLRFLIQKKGAKKTEPPAPVAPSKNKGKAAPAPAPAAPTEKDKKPAAFKGKNPYLCFKDDVTKKIMEENPGKPHKDIMALVG